MKLQSPRLMLGFKMNLWMKHREICSKRFRNDFIFELVFGEETDFYQSLLNDDLIDDSFGYQFVLEPTYSFSIITSATHEPDQLKDRLLTELKKYRGNLKDSEAFELLKKQFIGEFISSLNSQNILQINMQNCILRV